MTACEVLCWIAFREPRTKEDLDASFSAFLDRWWYVPADSLLKALEARAAQHPYCVVQRLVLRDWLDEPPEPFGYAHPVLSPRGPSILRRVRAQARIRDRRLVSYAELAARLRAEIEADTRTSAQLAEATTELVNALVSERLTAWGQRDLDGGGRNPSAEHEPIPAHVFMHPAVTVTLSNEVRADVSRPLPEWVDRRGPNFSDVRFKTAEVLALWPPSASDAVRSAIADDPPNHQVRHRFTPETLGAWFMLRVHTYPPDLPAPSEADDLAAALAYFDNVPRDVFRKIRRTKVPASWRKPGPRRPARR